MLAEELGGYVVIGSDDHGKVVPDLTPQLASLFDEATLRAKLKEYIAEPFDVWAAQASVASWRSTYRPRIARADTSGCTRLFRGVWSVPPLRPAAAFVSITPRTIPL
jgi:hypothetical protein